MAVSTIKSAGGDYTSRSAWWTAKGGADLVTATSTEEAETYSFSDTTAFSMTTGTVNASYYYRIYAATGEEHDGTPGTGSRLEASVDYGYVLNNGLNYTRIEYQSIRNTSATEPGGVTSDYLTGYHFIGNLISWPNNETSTSYKGLECTQGASVIIKDNMILCTAAVMGLDIYLTSGEVYNNTIVNSVTNVRMDLSGATLYFKNNIASGGSTADYSTTSITATNMSNNSSTDGSHPGTSGVTGTPTYTNTSGDDYSLASGDTSWHTAGIGPSSDAKVRTTDIVKATRSGSTCSMGCFEYISVGGGYNKHSNLLLLGAG